MEFSGNTRPGGGRAARARADAQRSEDAILAAARILFLDGGYDGVNLDQVAEVAGVSRQTVYNRFGGKEALFRATVRRHWAGVMTWSDQVRATIRAVRFPDPAAKLVGIARAFLRFIDDADQAAFTRLVIAESRARPWIGEEFHRFGQALTLETLAEILGAMHEQGVLDCPRPDIAARQFLALINEFSLWPKVMAVGAAQPEAPGPDFIVAEAVATFLCRYGRRGAGAAPADEG
ncbi:MAG: TetR/AcrR family transcriptional regulator [Caulobacter sp.]|nr:TetR/AcrR family transcriptional regulator [Caulobacter sp.]